MRGGRGNKKNKETRKDGRETGRKEMTEGRK
jgi:hypothetical protein